MTRLAPCPSSPNCVSSRAPASDRVHAIAPFTNTTLAAVKAAALALPRAKLVEETDGYVHIVVTTRLLRFRDDLELEADSDVVHVRSASRVGYGDLGVNRARVEAIRAALR